VGAVQQSLIRVVVTCRAGRDQINCETKSDGIERLRSTVTVLSAVEGRRTGIGENATLFLRNERTGPARPVVSPGPLSTLFAHGFIVHWEWAVWPMHGQPWQVSCARRARSAHSTSTTGCGRRRVRTRHGPCGGPGAGGGRWSGDSWTYVTYLRWTKERSPGGGPGAEDSGTACR
jgi:hypothetical protein